jgi:AcrR family transcriptional regulator
MRGFVTLPAMARGRTLDPQVSDAVLDAALTLLQRDGFARMTMEAVAREAGVGKPALYRRFGSKAELVVAAIDARLPPLEPPDLGDAEAEMRIALEGLPPDAEGYLALIGGLMAERAHHPELIETFRATILTPRRAAVAEVIARGQARGELRGDLDPVVALDLFAGQILARAFAGVDTGAAWREEAFTTWWRLMRP